MKILLGIVIIYFLIGVFLFFFQRSFMYFPTAEVMHPYTTEQFLIGEETIKVVVLNPGMTQGILYFGGNGESVVSNAANFLATFPNHTVYLVNYRGYGGSSGNPTEQGLYSDALHIHDALYKRHKLLSVIGRSLGTGVATYLAAERTINKMVLVTPYDSIQNVAQHQYPIYPMSLLLKDKYNSVDRIRNINSATLIIVAKNDRVISQVHSTRLIQQFPAAQVTVKTIQGADHNNLSQSEEYYYLLHKFI